MATRQPENGMVRREALCRQSDHPSDHRVHTALRLSPPALIHRNFGSPCRERAIGCRLCVPFAHSAHPIAHSGLGLGVCNASLSRIRTWLKISKVTFCDRMKPNVRSPPLLLHAAAHPFQSQVPSRCLSPMTGEFLLLFTILRV